MRLWRLGDLINYLDLSRESYPYADGSFYIKVPFERNRILMKQIPSTYGYLSGLIVPLCGWLPLHKAMFRAESYPYGADSLCIRLSFGRNRILMEPIPST